MPATFDLILKNGKCFIDGELRTIDIGISNGIIKSIDKIEKTLDQDLNKDAALYLLKSYYFKGEYCTQNIETKKIIFYL